MLDIPEIVVSQSIIDQVYSYNRLQLDNINSSVNSYLILRSDLNHKTSALVRHIGNQIVQKIKPHGSLTSTQIQPRDSRQAAFVDALTCTDILLTVGIGTAGTGKTTLALIHAAEQYKEKGKLIYLSKPAVTVGRSKAFGPVPGDIKEKFNPYLMSYQIILKKIFGQSSNEYFQTMERKGHLQYIPIELTRGTTFENCTFILDEAQNLNWHELNTIISRIGEQSEMIILGDLNQIDTNMDIEQTGLYQLINSNSFRDSSISSAIKLINQYRSPITKLVADINEELRNKHKKHNFI